jgi:sorting nexin-29
MAEAYISSIGISKEITKECLQGIICPLHKRGDQLECANYRGIALLNVTYKVFSNILYARLLLCVESKLGHYKEGFLRKKKIEDTSEFCIAKIFWKKIKEFRISIYLLFIDFKRAYDSIDRKKMYAAMNGINIPQKLIRLVKMMSNIKSQIKIQLKLSAPFIIHKSIQQGDALAQLLFNVTLE